MDGMEKISESIQIAESKKNDFGKSVLSLMVQWKDFEGKLDLAEKDFLEGLLELDSKEKKLNSEKESLELSRVSLEQRLKESLNREQDFDLFRDKKIRDLKLREDEFVRIRESYAKEVCEELNEQQNRVEEILAALKSEKLQMEGLNNFVEKRFKEMGLREEALENKRNEVEIIQISIEKRTRELEHNEKKIKERERKAELKEEELNLWKEHQSEIKSKERQLQLMVEDLEFQQKKSDFIRELNEKRMEELELKEKKLEENLKKDFLSKEKGCGFGKEYLKKELEDLQSRKKGFEEEMMEFELRKKGLRESLIEFDLNNTDCLLQKNLLEEESEKLHQKKGEFAQRIDRFELAEKQLKESLEEFELKKKESILRTQLLEKESEDLESKWREFEYRIEEFNAREKVLEKSFGEFRAKEKQFESEKKLFEKESELLKSRRKELEECIKKFELREKEFELNEKKIQSKRKLLEKDSKHLELRRKELQEKIEKFELREKGLELKEKKLESEKMLLEKDSEHLESSRKALEESIQKLESREKELDLKDKQLESEKKLLEKDSKHLESSRKALEESIQKFELREREIELEEKKLESEKKLLEKDSQHLESSRKALEESIQKLELTERELDLKDKQLDSVTHAHLKTEPVHDAAIQSSSCNDIDIKFVISIMGGKDLQIFLNEHAKKHHLMAEEVLKSLHLSKEPAKLVLDAMEGFFPPHLRKGSREFSGNVVRRSCNLLLQQLIRISPQVQPSLKEEALKLAREWKIKLNRGNSLEVSSFLYLLGAYNLAPGFDAEDIILYLESVSKHQEKLEPELCGRLGLKERIPSIIEKLLKSNRSMEAIKFIYGFELVDIFPPVPILKNYLKHVKICANTKHRKKMNNNNVQNESINMRVAAAKSVIRCIANYKLESEYSPEGLENSIKQLLMQKKGEECRGSSNCHKAEGKQKVEVKQISSSALPSQPKTNRLAPDSSNILSGASHPMAVIIASMDGKNLLSFLSSHVLEHGLLHNEVSSALKISDNSPKLVLDAVLHLHDSHLTEEMAKSCIFLLEQLMRLSPDIMPVVKEAALNIAFDWQEKLRAENGNSLLTLTYQLLITTYGLDSKFHRDELSNLYQTVAKQKPSPGLSHAFGMSKDAFNASPLQSQVETGKATLKSLLVNNLTVSTSMVPELDGESHCTNMDIEVKECVADCSWVSTFILSSDPAALILDALRHCWHSNFLGNKNLKLIVKSFTCVLEQLMTVPLEIKPNVKERAYEFACHWKAKSIGPWEALGFLQLVASYQLSSFFSSDQLFFLLEAVYTPKKAGNCIRKFGLVDKVPGFISKLIMKKKLILAFAYVYEFELADLFPPVALLKQHVLYSKVVAKKIFLKGSKTTDAEDKSIVSEISALKTVVKLIMRHNLQSEYSADELRSTIKELERQRESLRASMQKVDANEEVSLTPEIKKKQVNNKRWHTSDSTYVNEAHLQPANKFPRLVSASEYSNHHPIQCKRPSQYPGDYNSEPYLLSRLRTSRQYSVSGSPLVCPPQNRLLPLNDNAVLYNHIPPLRKPDNHSARNGKSLADPNYQRIH